MSKNQKQKNQAIVDNSEDSAKSKHGFKQTGNAMVGEDKKNTKGKR